MLMRHKLSSCGRAAAWALVLSTLAPLGCQNPGPAPRGGFGAGATARAGQRFTIVLAQYPHEQFDSVMMAQGLQARARKALATDDVFLNNESRWLTVAYGRFDSQAAAERELRRVKRLYPSLGAGPLQFCFVTELPAPDPPAPKAWNLLENSCGYTLEIGTYYDVPENDYFDRKQDAVRAVENLRRDGQQAFFVHGRHESRVYVGCFDPPRASHVTTGADILAQLDPVTRAQLARHKFRLENGGQVYRIVQDQAGRRMRIAQEPVMVYVPDIREQVTF